MFYFCMPYVINQKFSLNLIYFKALYKKWIYSKTILFFPIYAIY